MLLRLLTACCPVLPHTPSIDIFDVSPGSCGAWSGHASVTGPGTLIVTADDKEVGRWTSPGQLDVDLSGTGKPGATVRVHASFVNAAAEHQVQLPPIPNPTLFVMSGDQALDVTLNSECPDVAWQTEIAVRPGGWVATRLLKAGTTSVALPAFPSGDYTATIRVVRGTDTLATETETFSTGEGAPSVDADHDGQSPPIDCDDHDPRIGPMQPEAPQPNGRDDNCDGRVDEGTIVYDDDGDGLAEMAGDCDDQDSTQRPGAAELPNCLDDDCDKEVDEGVRLPMVDDPYERSSPHDLGGANSARFPVEIVSHDSNDEESFRLYAQDGLFDAFFVGARLDGLPTGAVYDVEILSDSGRLLDSGRVATEHEGVGYGGRGFHDDSGSYVVRLRPVTLPRAWCPVRVVISAG